MQGLKSGHFASISQACASLTAHFTTHTRGEPRLSSVDTPVVSCFLSDYCLHQRCCPLLSLHHHLQSTITNAHLCIITCVLSRPFFPFSIIPQLFLSHCIITVTMLRSLNGFQLHPLPTLHLHCNQVNFQGHQPSHGSALTGSTDPQRWLSRHVPLELTSGFTLLLKCGPGLSLSPSHTHILT